MKRYRSVASSAIVVLLLTAWPTRAQELALSIRVGSLGPGLEVTGALTPSFNYRVGGNLFSYQREDEIKDLEIRVKADSDLQLGSARALIDFFPLRRGLRMSAGLIYNANQVETRILPLESYELDGKRFAPEKIGQLTAKVTHKASLNPYLGLGFGNAVRPGKRVGVVLDVGVLYTDSPNVEMEGTGMIAPTANEAAELEENLEGIKWYPLISIGVSYKFWGDN